MLGIKGGGPVAKMIIVQGGVSESRRIEYLLGIPED